MKWMGGRVSKLSESGTTCRKSTASRVNPNSISTSNNTTKTKCASWRNWSDCWGMSWANATLSKTYSNNSRGQHSKPTTTTLREKSNPWSALWTSETEKLNPTVIDSSRLSEAISNQWMICDFILSMCVSRCWNAKWMRSSRSTKMSESSWRLNTDSLCWGSMNWMPNCRPFWARTRSWWIDSGRGQRNVRVGDRST